MHVQTLLVAAALVPWMPAQAGPGVVTADGRVQLSADYLQGRAAGPGSNAWTLVVARDDEPAADAGERLRGWSEPGAMRALAERMSLSIANVPSTEGRRIRQVTLGLRLQF